MRPACDARMSGLGRGVSRSQGTVPERPCVRRGPDCSAEDFYEKGPSLSGHTETFEVAQPLLDDFFAAIDERAAGGDVAATFRFGHAETIVPFAALLRLPGSTVAAPDKAASTDAADVYDYENNPWRGAEVTPMAANVQWDVRGTCRRRPGDRGRLHASGADALQRA